MNRITHSFQWSEQTGMERKPMHRREFLLGSVGAGIVALGGCASPPAAESARVMLQEAVGRRETIAGMVAVAVDHGGARMISHGSSGVANLAMDGDTIFEIGSITKVLTALLLADMAARGEVSFNDSVANYLPPSTISLAVSNSCSRRFCVMSMAC
jgi:CubicO group peptidase (beta-lactamase class C family)